MSFISDLVDKVIPGSGKDVGNLLTTAATVAAVVYAPQFVGNYVATAAFNAGISAATVLAAGTIAQTATTLFLISQAGSSSAPDPVSQAQASGVLLNLAGNTAAVPVVYGIRRVGGTRVFTGVSGASNEYLHVVIVLGEGEIHGVSNIYIDDVNVTDAKFSGLVEQYVYTGSDTQTANAGLIADFPDEWTSAHAGKGIAYIYLKLKFSQNAFSGFPTVTADVMGRKVYDPRTATTALSSNPAICIRDYLTNARYGRGIDASLIDDASIISAANYCDEMVAIPGSASARRYTCDGVVDINQSAYDNIKALLTSCRGLLVYSGGYYKLIIDKTATSSFAFTEDNITGNWSISQPGRRSKYNRVTANFFNPYPNWQPDLAISDSPAYRTVDAGLLLETKIDLPFTADSYRAQQLAGLHLKQSRFGIICTFTAFQVAMRCEVGDVVSITHTTPGWSGKLFRILQLTLRDDDEVEVIAQEYDATVYNLDTLTAVTSTPTLSLPDAFSVAAPSALAVAVENITQADGTIIPRMVATWTAAPDAFVVSYEIAWSENAGPWQTTYTTATKWVIPASVTGRTYDVRIRSVNTIGAQSSWVTLTGTTAAAPAVAPAAPTLTATAGLFNVRLTWTFGDSRTDIRGVEIWFASTNDRSGATRLALEPYPALEYTHPGLAPGAGGYYWSRTVDTFGNVSAWYPSGATSGLYAVSSTDPTALTTQLNRSLGLGQLVSELAAPIGSISGNANATAIASLYSALSDYDLSGRMQWQEAVTNATISVDSITGKIQLLATANVTTDVQNQLNSVQIMVNAHDATLTSTVATLSTVQGNLTSTQAAVTILQGQVTTSASTVYVDSSIANATGGLNVTSANAYQNLAQEALLSAIDSFNTGNAMQAVQANVSTAQDSIKTNADAIQSLTTSFSALVATYSTNAASTAAAIITEQTTRADAVSAVASRATVLEAAVNHPTTGLATRASVSYVDSASATQTAAIASSSTVLTAAFQAADAATLSSAQAYVGTYTYAKSTIDSNIASAVSVVSARLDTGDYATVKATAVASASAITGLSAQYTLNVDTNGHVAGMQLASGSGGTSVVFLADKFAFVSPDGSGAPKYVFTVGSINGSTEIGLNGNVLIDGTITTRTITANTLNADRLIAGSITADRIATGAITASSGLIADLAVTTLKLGTNAVTVPASGSGGVGYSPACTLYMPYAGTVYVTMNLWVYETEASTGGTMDVAYSVQINASTGGADGYCIVHTARARHSSIATACRFDVPAGTWTFTGALSVISGAFQVQGGTIMAIGTMK